MCLRDNRRSAICFKGKFRDNREIPHNNWRKNNSLRKKCKGTFLTNETYCKLFSKKKTKNSNPIFYHFCIFNINGGTEGYFPSVLRFSIWYSGLRLHIFVHTTAKSKLKVMVNQSTLLAMHAGCCKTFGTNLGW